jgi:hypothetical protein
MIYVFLLCISSSSFFSLAAAAAATAPAAALLLRAAMSKTWICLVALLLWQLLSSSAINEKLNRMTQVLLCMSM